MKVEELSQFISGSKKQCKIVSFIGCGVKYELRDKGYIVYGNVYLNNRNLTEIPFKFYKVEGDFYCDNNQLTSLVNSPKTVEGNFYCTNNLLTSLEGCPKSVGGNFSCQKNPLKELKEHPQVGRKIFIDNPKLVEDYYNQLKREGLNDLGYSDTENTDII